MFERLLVDAGSQCDGGEDLDVIVLSGFKALAALSLLSGFFLFYLCLRLDYEGKNSKSLLSSLLYAKR